MTSASRLLLLLLLITVLAGGCAAVGPASISNGRMVYREVINYTEDQQVLDMIVRERYAQTFGILNVASVTANVKFRAELGTEFRAWGSADFTDDLVPLSIGAAYEENPTISYVPLQGEIAMRRLAMPITVEEGFVLMRAAREREIASRQLYRSINGVPNPVGGPPPPEFERISSLFIELRRDGLVGFGLDPAAEGEEPRFLVSLHDYGDEHADLVRAYLESLGIEDATIDGRDILLPFHLVYAPKRSTNSILVETRSVLEWLRHAGSLIDVPPPHLEMGIVEPSDWGEEPVADRFITIRSSKKRPKDAIVAVPFRGWWFYIDATDTRSKHSFGLIRFLVRLRLDRDSPGQQLPVLTVPVG